MYQAGKANRLNERFRGYLPVVVDVETGGFNEQTDALLEIAAVIIDYDEAGDLHPVASYSTHVTAFEGSNIDPKSLEINGIDPDHPLRAARAEREALSHILTPIRKAVSDANCTRAILVGHNAFFDLKFLNAAVERTRIKKNPFHPFSCFDTVSLCVDWPTGKPYWREQQMLRVWNGTLVRRTRQSMTRARRPIFFAV